MGMLLAGLWALAWGDVCFSLGEGLGRAFSWTGALA